MGKTILLFLALLVAPCLASAQEIMGKFGIIDAEALIALMPETETVERELKALADRYDSEIMKRTVEYQTKLTDFLSQRDSLPTIIQEAREQEIGHLQQKVDELRRVALEDLQRQQQQRMAPIIERVQQAIATVGEREGFIYVLDSQKSGLVYFSLAQCVDLAPMVKAELGLADE